MITYTNKSSFNDLPKIILIDNVDLLSKNSLNALLKNIEEPNNNTYFFLIFDNNRNIPDTLKSRCIRFNLSLPSSEYINIASKIIGSNIDKFLNEDFINHYSTPGDLINLLKICIFYINEK